MRKAAIILQLLILCLGHLQGQQTNSSRGDSARQRVIDLNESKISAFEWERLKDSLKWVELEDSIKSLKSSEKLKREELKKQLIEIQSKDSIQWQHKKKVIDSLRLTTNGYPVYGLFGDTLFIIYSRRGDLSAKERAAAITVRINKLGHSLVFTTDSIKLIPNESMVELAFAENTLMSVSENDAIWNSTTADQLAKHYLQIIKTDIDRYKQETSFRRLAKQICIALLIILLLSLIVVLLNRLSRWINQKIELKENKSLKGIHFRSYTISDSHKQVQLLQRLVTIVKWVLIILVTYLSLPLLFSLFPWTRKLADTLTGYIFGPLRSIGSSIWNYLPNLFIIAIISTLFYYALKVIRFIKFEITTGKLSIPGFYPEWANPTFQIIRILLLAFLFILIFPYLPGSNSPVFKGVSVFLGFLFTFSSAGSLSNIISGIVLTYMRQFKLGDRVKIGDVTGDVVEKSMLVTRIKTVKNEIISIPNTTVMSSPTINFSSEAKKKGLILHTTVTIGYDVPWREMHKALLKAAGQTEYILTEPAPFVLQSSLDDFYVSYQLNAYTREANQQINIYSWLHQNIQDCCSEAGIEIMSPHYMSARDGNRTTIPKQYLDKNYKAPGFKVDTNKDPENSNDKLEEDKPES